MNYRCNCRATLFGVLALGIGVPGAAVAPASTTAAILVGLAIIAVLGGFKKWANMPGDRLVGYCLLMLAAFASAGLYVTVMAVFTGVAIKLVVWSIEHLARLQGASDANMGWVYICVTFVAICFGSQIILGSLYTGNQQLWPAPVSQGSESSGLCYAR